MPASETKRENWADILRGLAMLFVIIGHYVKPLIPYYAFTSPIKIPLFFAITGYVFKMRDGNQLSFFKNLLLKIVIPWLFLASLPVIAIGVYKGSVNYILNGFLDILTGEMFWYMPCCIIAEIIWFYVNKLLKKPLLIVIAAVVLSAAGIVLKHFEILNICMINRALAVQQYILLGYLFRQYRRFFDKLKWQYLVCALVAYAALGTAFLLLFPGEKLDLHSLSYINIPISTAMIVIGCLGLFAFMSRLDIRIGFMQFIGRNTLVYYMWSTYFAVACIFVLRRIGVEIPNVYLSALVRTLAACIGCGICALILNRFVPFLVGKKRRKKTKAEQ